eukprot:TRINITY_DN32978_c0_g1_i1.p2 TRINITY_DN32978_c0_g1~~TRINITY_DN32978_c0_g1_i1.p2  ORF type:complete len:102 (-),score=9.21 TRINITY_DN32978_c0_g1_i1:279-584(-)
MCRTVAESDPFYLRMAKRMGNSAAAHAGLETHARDSLSHWTSYRWDWESRTPVEAITADHGGKSKNLAPVARANSDGLMFWSSTADAQARRHQHNGKRSKL